MAAVLEIDRLTSVQRSHLLADLHVSSTQFIPGRTVGWQNVTDSKAIDFYVRYSQTRRIAVPYWYGGQLTQIPMFNRQRVFKKVTPFSFVDGFQLRPYQKEVVDIALEKYRRDGCCFFNVFCAFGKTVVSTYLSQHFARTTGLLTLITYPGTTVEESWLGTFQEFTSAKVFLVPTGHQFTIPEDTQVIICSDGRLKKIPQDILDNVGHFVIDEADLFCTQSHVEGLLSVQPMVVTVLTATYERDDGMEKMLDLLSGTDRILRIDCKPFYVLKYVSPYTSINYKVGARGKIWESIAKELSDIPERNLLICQLVLMNLREKIIVLTYHIEHAVNLHGWISQMIAPYGANAGLMVQNDRTYDDCNVLVGTFSKIGRGFDERKKCRNWGQDPRLGQRRFNMVILAMSTKKIEQPAGRAGRADEPVIIDIVDQHENTKKHWTHRQKWYKARNGHIRTVTDPYQSSWFNLRDGLVEIARNTPFEPPEPVSAESSVPPVSSNAHLKALLARGLNPTNR